MKGNSEHVNIRGIVVPVDWDTQGNTVKAAVFTSEEDEYLIKEDTGSKGLFELMRQEVEVTGTVSEEAGQKVITVERCRTLKRGRIP
jgi:hypothetical protein